MWQNFYQAMKRGLISFFFYCTVIGVFRLAFILWMNDYWREGTGFFDICLAMWRGGCLSLQTAGVLTAGAGLVAGAAALVSKPAAWFLYRKLNVLQIVALSILYMARFPYYRQFHSGFNQLVFNTFNDDIGALLMSMVTEFWLPLRLFCALCIAWVLYHIWRFFVSLDLPSIFWIIPFPIRWIGRLIFLLFLCILVRVAAYGGGFGWQTAVNWENAGVTKDNLLNEAILDDCQALYRGYVLKNRLEACNGLEFKPEEIKRLAAGLTKKPMNSDRLEVYLTREAQGAQLETPRHIFLILAESYANWALLPEYEGLHIADGMRGILAASDSDWCPAMLPNGDCTVSAVTGVVTGLADANLYLTTMEESFKGPYLTAAAPPLKELGYQTNFWYAGPASWERAGAFVTAQGFEHFYSQGDFADVKGSVWGCEDEYLYREVLKKLGDAPSFNVVLTVANHSPFAVDLKAKGFDFEKTRQALPENLRSDEDLLKKLGHFWYGDRELANFIAEVKKRYPDSLFVVVGDHADRYNIEKSPGMYHRLAVPFIVTGRGVHKGLLLKDSAGSQIDVVPTIIEMIAPKGFQYAALGESLTRTAKRGVNYGWWITHNTIGKADTVPLEALDFAGQKAAVDEAGMQDYIAAIRAISWWLPKYGTLLDMKLMQENQEK